MHYDGAMQKLVGPWNLNFILNYICNALLKENEFNIIHKGRETNFVTDALAKQGLQRRDEFPAWC